MTEYRFPHGACEPGVGSHPYSAFTNLIIIIMLARTFFTSAQDPKIHSSFFWLVASELWFEITHGICHIKHNMFFDNCFDFQHASGLGLLLALGMCVETLAGNPRVSCMQCLLVLGGDFFLAIMGIDEIWRAQYAFVLFTYVFYRAYSIGDTLSREYLDIMKISAIAMAFQTVLFYVDGNFCSWFMENVAKIPWHVCLELGGMFIFWNSNRAFIKGLHADALKISEKKRTELTSD